MVTATHHTYVEATVDNVVAGGHYRTAGNAVGITLTNDAAHIAVTGNRAGIGAAGHAAEADIVAEEADKTAHAVARTRNGACVEAAVDAGGVAGSTHKATHGADTRNGAGITAAVESAMKSLTHEVTGIVARSSHIAGISTMGKGGILHIADKAAHIRLTIDTAKDGEVLDSAVAHIAEKTDIVNIGRNEEIVDGMIIAPEGAVERMACIITDRIPRLAAPRIEQEVVFGTHFEVGGQEEVVTSEAVDIWEGFVSYFGIDGGAEPVEVVHAVDEGRVEDVAVLMVVLFFRSDAPTHGAVGDAADLNGGDDIGTRFDRGASVVAHFDVCGVGAFIDEAASEGDVEHSLEVFDILVVAVGVDAEGDRPRDELGGIELLNSCHHGVASGGEGEEVADGGGSVREVVEGVGEHLGGTETDGAVSHIAAVHATVRGHLLVVVVVVGIGVAGIDKTGDGAIVGGGGGGEVEVTIVEVIGDGGVVCTGSGGTSVEVTDDTADVAATGNTSGIKVQLCAHIVVGIADDTASVCGSRFDIGAVGGGFELHLHFGRADDTAHLVGTRDGTGDQHLADGSVQGGITDDTTDAVGTGDIYTLEKKVRDVGTIHVTEEADIVTAGQVEREVGDGVATAFEHALEGGGCGSDGLHGHACEVNVLTDTEIDTCIIGAACYGIGKGLHISRCGNLIWCSFCTETAAVLGERVCRNSHEQHKYCKEVQHETISVLTISVGFFH